MYTQFFGQAFVRSFHAESGIYQVVLFGGQVLGYFAGKDLKEQPWTAKGERGRGSEGNAWVNEAFRAVQRNGSGFGSPTSYGGQQSEYDLWGG